MNYQQRTLKAVTEIHNDQKTGVYSDTHCPLCRIYRDKKGNCVGCVSCSVKGKTMGCCSFKTYMEVRGYKIRAKFWQDVIPILKAIDKKFFTPRFCKSHPEQARKKFAFMIEIDNRIYDKYK